MSKAIISKLRIYPIKSLGFVEVEEAEIGKHSLKDDRLFAMIDAEGRFVNGKRTHRVNDLQTVYDLSMGQVQFKDKETGQENSFELKEGNAALDEYLSKFFDLDLKLLRNEEGQFLDIPVQSSVTVVSEASLDYLQKDIQRHSLDNMRLRFRSNIELSGVEAFWEEQLYHKPGMGMKFKIGAVEMIGISPRQRCNVPPQNPENGEMDYHFVKNMVVSRYAHEPSIDHLMQFARAPYYLTINVYVPKSELGKKIRLNDSIEIIGPIDLNG